MTDSVRAQFSVPAPRAEQKFTDKLPLLSSTEAVYEASRCLYCHDAPCIPRCPTAIDIPTFIREMMFEPTYSATARD